MRTLRNALPAMAAMATGLLLVGVGTSGATEALHAQQRSEVTSETVERWMVELSNRGRWGAADELGTLNLITPEHRVRAARRGSSGPHSPPARKGVSRRGESSPLVW